MTQARQAGGGVSRVLRWAAGRVAGAPASEGPGGAVGVLSEDAGHRQGRLDALCASRPVGVGPSDRDVDAYIERLELEIAGLRNRRELGLEPGSEPWSFGDVVDREA